MDTYDSLMAPRFRGLLARRARELQGTLSHETDAMHAEGLHDVSGFSDAAANEAMAMVDEANAEHAAGEFELIRAALARIDDGSYGRCLDCGSPIDLRRLLAVPTAACCTACQAAHERH